MKKNSMLDDEAFVTQGADPVWVKIAASNSSDAAKAVADFVCTGTNDELVIQQAIDACARDGRNVYLFNGRYYLDSVRDFGDGGPKAAIRFPIMCRQFKFIGQGAPTSGYNVEYSNDYNGVRFRVRNSIWNDANGESVDAFRGGWTERGIQNGSSLVMANMNVLMPDAQHSARCIDLRRVDKVEMRNVALTALGDRIAAGDRYPWAKCGPLPIPIYESIGLTMTDGSNLSTVRYDNVGSNGFGQGIQAGGEHVICNNCWATFGLYGWTFGNYDFHCGFNHPITLINCCDEQNVNLPLFADCGDHDAKGNLIHGRQEVTMISFNCERVAGHTPGKKIGNNMRETKPGTWCGYIGFTRQPEWCAINSVDLPIWQDDGSGSGFRTENMCHKKVCGTAERLSYYPFSGQQIFDTDLNKLLICINPAKRIWVDTLGNIAEEGK